MVELFMHSINQAMEKPLLSLLLLLSLYNPPIRPRGSIYIYIYTMYVLEFRHAYIYIYTKYVCTRVPTRRLSLCACIDPSQHPHIASRGPYLGGIKNNNKLKNK